MVYVGPISTFWHIFNCMTFICIRKLQISFFFSFSPHFWYTFSIETGQNDDIFTKYEEYPWQKMKNNQFRPFHGSQNKHLPGFYEISENQRFFFIYGSSRCQKIGQILSKLGNLCWIVSVCKYISRKYQKLGFLRRLDLDLFPHLGPLCTVDPESWFLVIILYLEK